MSALVIDQRWLDGYTPTWRITLAGRAWFVRLDSKLLDEWLVWDARERGGFIAPMDVLAQRLVAACKADLAAQAGGGPHDGRA